MCHGDDLFYLFPFSMPGFPAPLKTATDHKAAALFQKMVVHFARTGKGPARKGEQPTGAAAVGGGSGDHRRKVAVFDRRGKLLLKDEEELGEEEENRLWSCGANRGMEATEKLSRRPVEVIHAATADKRGLVTDPKQLFS